MSRSKLRRSATVGLAATIALAGSLWLAPTAPAGATQATSEAATDGDRPGERTVVRPFIGSGSGSGFATVEDDGTISFVIDGTQHFTVFGQSTWHLEGVCTNPTCTSSISTSTNVNRRGETLVFTEVLTEGVPFSTFLITGGTGRFAGATGYGTTTGTLVIDPSNPLAFTTTFESVGEIILRPGRRS